MKPEDLLKTKVGNANRAIIEKALASVPGRAASSTLALAPVPDTERKPLPVPSLDPRQKTHGGSQKHLVIVITIISFRRHELDEVNLFSGAKPLQDAIATSLGVDDRDRRIKWEFRQVIGEGPEGTIVKIDTYASS